MSSQQHEPGHRYTVEEFDALPEDNSARYELQEGLVLLSPRPAKSHAKVIKELLVQIAPQLPPELDVWTEVDVDLTPLPATVRVPDLVIVDASALQRPGLTRSAEVLVAVEILSPGSVRTDTKIKIVEYADAGIPHYWVVDPEPPVTATVYRLVDGEYEEFQRAEGAFEVREPCPLRIDLDRLRPNP